MPGHYRRLVAAGHRTSGHWTPQNAIKGFRPESALLSSAILDFVENRLHKILRPAPVCRRGYLIIEQRAVGAYQFALFCAYFIFDHGGGSRCTVHDRKPYGMSAPRGLRQYFIFVFFWSGKLCVMLHHALQHILALADVDGFSIQQDSINARALKLRR